MQGIVEGIDWRVFAIIMAIGFALLAGQWAASWFDGYFSQSQLHARGIDNAWSILEHGGVWSDIFIITPLVAYHASKHQFGYFEWYGTLTLAIAVGLTFVAVWYVYRPMGVKEPEALAHDGIVPLAGCIHAVFAIAAIWIFELVYFTPADPPISKTDLVVTSVLLTPFFFLGVAKFSSRWVFAVPVRWQVAIETVALWVVTAVRLVFAR